MKIQVIQEDERIPIVKNCHACNRNITLFVTKEELKARENGAKIQEKHFMTL